MVEAGRPRQECVFVRVIKRLILIATVTLWVGSAARAAVDEAGLLFFENKIRPLLSEQCYKCHSAKAEKVKGMLRLDSRRGLITGGEGSTRSVTRTPTCRCRPRRGFRRSRWPT
jgi:hypothetical protein